MDNCYICYELCKSEELKQCVRCEEYHCKNCIKNELCKYCEDDMKVEAMAK